MKLHHTTFRPLLALLAILPLATAAANPPSATPPQPLSPADLVFAEKDGIITGEAEHFTAQEKPSVRAWHIFSTRHRPNVRPDADATHVLGASGGAYLEVLPDTRPTHAEPLVKGENFHDEPGELAILSYPIFVTTPGRYHVWCRVYSTGTEDNGLHVGLDGQWPDSGRRWQTVQKNGWSWDSRQRTAKVHEGVPGQLYLDIPTAGLHTFHISMREDGVELDKWLLTRDPAYVPTGTGPAPVAHAGKIPEAIRVPQNYIEGLPPAPTGALIIRAADLNPEGTDYYKDMDRWLGINPEKAKTASISTPVPAGNGRYDVTLFVVGESDGQATFEVTIGNRALDPFTAPLSEYVFEEGLKYSRTWRGIDINEGSTLTIKSTIASADGKEWSRARWVQLVFTQVENDPGRAASDKSVLPPKPDPTLALVEPRQPNGNASITVGGELKQWHAVTLDLAGPFAHENDNQPNPFTDYAYTVTFKHESGSPTYTVPGYFAADGNAGQTSASSGTVWRAHLSPDKPGKWSYTTSFTTGPRAAIGDFSGLPLAPFHGITGSFIIDASDKKSPDFRAKGRLTYDGTRYLKFSGNGEIFLKAGADSPETLLAYVDFDNTQALKPKVPLKTWDPHHDDYRPGDPTWRNGKGKNLIGALNYLASEGLNSISFLTYNAAGDGDNIWPFVHRDDKFHYDCSKLDQWGIVFAHAQKLGLHLHFKLQENEQDDQRLGAGRKYAALAEAMDGGATGPERKLYFREMIARYGHHLALLWNLGEENTQTVDEHNAMADYLWLTDPYHHNIVIHSFPEQQDRVYTPLLGTRTKLTGASLQNNWDKVHQRTLKWLRESTAAGRTWVVCNDEQNPAGGGIPADPGYPGAEDSVADGKVRYTLHDIRKYTLWGNLLAGGAGVEYYFGYRLPENDLLCQDFRSRDKSWDYCRFALEFFAREKLPLGEMASANALIGNPTDDNSKYCLAQPGVVYLVYLPNGGTDTMLDLTSVKGEFTVHWYNPRTGGPLASGSVTKLTGGTKAPLGAPPADTNEDWLALIRR